MTRILIADSASLEAISLATAGLPFDAAIFTGTPREGVEALAGTVAIPPEPSSRSRRYCPARTVERRESVATSNNALAATRGEFGRRARCAVEGG